MYLESLGRVIAERRLVHKSMPDRQITVRIGCPEQFIDAEAFFCPFQVIGLGDEKIRYAGGMDGVQALQLVIKMVGAYLGSQEEVKAGLVSWEGGDSGELGFE